MWGRGARLLRGRPMGGLLAFVAGSGLVGLTTFSRDATLHHSINNANTGKIGMEDDVAITRYTVSRAVDVLAKCVVQIRTPIHAGWLGASQGMGSGFVFEKANGKTYIMTNAHVCQNATKVTVIKGEIETEATVIGTDIATDIALLLIQGEPEHLQCASLGSSTNARLGEFVIAVGSPLGLDDSVSLGIISNKRSMKLARVPGMMGGGMVAETVRAGEDDGSFGYIQVDCAINEGSSGGPIADLNARVVGVTTLKSEGGEGLAFAVPIEAALASVNRIRERGSVSAKKKSLGIVAQDVGGRVVLIISVAPGSLAEEAGLKPNDLVIGVNGSEMSRGVSQLQEAIKAGNVDLDLVRRNKQLRATIKTKQ